MKKNLGVLALLICGLSAQSQGTFQNLDFERANVPLVPTNQFGAAVATTDGLPGWTAYFGSSQATTIGHNDTTFGGAGVSIEGPDWPSSQILQGNYSVLIASSSAGPLNTAAIAQTGQIPQTAKTLVFWWAPLSSIEPSFNGQAIALTQVGAGSNYRIMMGDVSPFAGQTGELRFTSSVNGGGFLDNIQFSSQPIPEPSVLGLSLLALIGIFTARRRWWDD